MISNLSFTLPSDTVMLQKASLSKFRRGTSAGADVSAVKFI
jgi:hypothetical protein